MACERDRKFQSTLEKCAKRIEKGDEFLKKQWSRVEAREAVVMHQTEKFASEVKKELSRIQREREKLRGWLVEARPEHHDKMNAAKELVETNMYKYRTFERAWKNRSGVFANGHQQPMQPEERERVECKDQWAALLESMRLLQETTEGEELACADAADKRAFSRRRKACDKHVQKMEQVLRALENEHLQPDEVGHVQDIVEYLLEEGSAADDTLLNDFGAYHDLSLDGKIDSNIGRLVHKPRSGSSRQRSVSAESHASTSPREGQRVGSTTVLERSRGGADVADRSLRGKAAAGALARSQKPAVLSKAAPGSAADTSRLATIRVVPLQRLTSEGARSVATSGSAAPTALAGLRVQVPAAAADELHNLNTPGTQANAIRKVAGSSDSLGSQPPLSGQHSRSEAAPGQEGESLHLPSDDLFLKLTPLRQDGSDDSVCNFGKSTAPSADSSNHENKIPATLARAAPEDVMGPDRAAITFTSASSNSIASPSAHELDAHTSPPSDYAACSGCSNTSNVVCKDLINVFKSPDNARKNPAAHILHQPRAVSAAQHTVPAPATPREQREAAGEQGCSTGKASTALQNDTTRSAPVDVSATHMLQSDGNKPQYGTDTAATLCAAGSEAPSPICATFSPGVAVAFCSSHRLPVHPVAARWAEAGESAVADSAAAPLIVKTLVTQEDVDFFHSLNAKNDELHAQWAAEEAAERAARAAAADGEPDAFKEWRESARRTAVVAAAGDSVDTTAVTSTRSATAIPDDAHADTNSSLTSSSEPLLAVFYLDVSSVRRRAAKLHLESLGFRYHTSLQTWFHRLKQPTHIGTTSERGHVVFFNCCRPAAKHPLVRYGMAEPYPTIPDGKGGRATPGQALTTFSAPALEQRRKAAAAGWTFMQARDFEFEFKFLSPMIRAITPT